MNSRDCRTKYEWGNMRFWKKRIDKRENKKNEKRSMNTNDCRANVIYLKIKRRKERKRTIKKWILANVEQAWMRFWKKKGTLKNEYSRLSREYECDFETKGKQRSKRTNEYSRLSTKGKRDFVKRKINKINIRDYRASVNEILKRRKKKVGKRNNNNQSAEYKKWTLAIIEFEREWNVE